MKEKLLVQLDPEEEVLGVIRRSLFYGWWRWFIILVWLLLPFLIFHPLVELGTFGLVIFVVLIFSGLWQALRQRLEWRYTMFLVTDKRVIDIDHRGVFSREISELPFADISEVIVRQPGLNKFFGLGTVRLHTKKINQFDLEIKGVRHPLHVRDLIVDVQYLTGDYVNQAEAKKE